MTDSPPAPDDRTLRRPDDQQDTPRTDPGLGPGEDAGPDEHDEQPGFPDGPTSPAEGGD